MDVWKSDAQLKKYLLGLIESSAEQTIVEERLMTDESYYQSLLLEEDALVDDYLEDNLTADEHHAFEAHFLLAPEHQRKFTFAKSLTTFLTTSSQDSALEALTNRKPTKERGFRDLLFGWKVGLTFASIIVVAGVLAWLWLARATNDTATAMVALNRAYANERPVEARISDLGYAPFSRTRGAEDVSQIDVNQRDKAELLLLSQFDKDQRPETLHALGRLYLSKNQLDRAQEFLERAKTQTPSDAGLSNDLGVTYLQRFVTDSTRPQFLPMALEEFDGSISLDGGFLPAYFNRAICLHLMNLPNEERNAWTKYLELDPNSSWAQEAQTRLDGLRSDVEGDPPAEVLESRFVEYVKSNNDDGALKIASQNRELIKEKYLPQRLAFSIVDSSDAETRADGLSALNRLASIERERINDHFATDIYRLYSNRSEKQIATLKHAQDLVREGYQLCLSDKFNDAVATFKQASNLFVAADDVVEAQTIANYFTGYCLENIGKIDEADKIFKSVKEFSEQRGYRWLAVMSAYWWLGSQEYRGLKSFTETRDAYAIVLRDAQAMGDGYMSQKLLLSIILEDDRVGDDEATLGHILQLLEISNEPGLSVRQKYRNLDKIIQISSQDGMHALSNAVLNESISVSNQINDPAFAFGAAINAGIVHTSSHRFPEAAQWLAKAEEITSTLADQHLRDGYLSRTYLERGRLEHEFNQDDKALSDYDRALALSGPTAANSFVFDIRKARINSLIATGSTDALSDEIPQTIRLAEEYRSRIQDERERSNFFETEQSLYDAAVENQLRLKDSRGAYNYAEMSSSRSLLDWIQGDSHLSLDGDSKKLLLNTSSSSLTLDEIQRRIPANSQIVEYRCLPDALVIWIVSRNEFSSVAVPVSSNDLAAIVKKYLYLIKARSPTNRTVRDEIARDLYQVLISPIQDSLDRKKDLSVVPNRSLFYLPFASLLSPTGERLIEEFPVVYAPSASVFISCSDRASDKRTDGEENILAIGNPSIDKQRFPELADISDSANEARTVANTYPTSRLMTGTSVTKVDFLAASKTSDVIHFAGHYVVDPQSPQLSKLLLADESGDSAFLTNADLAHEKFPRTRLIVLSGCQTALEGTLQGEGAIGLARTFLGTGIPVVVASQWPVDSAATTDLMISFHKFRRAGLPSSEALRQAQISLLRQTDNNNSDPYYWSGFAVFGGAASF